MPNPAPPDEPFAPAATAAEPRLETGEAWQRLCETLAAASQRVLGEGVPGTPRDRAEGFRYLTRFLAAGIVSCVSHDDPDHPVFARMIDYTMPWGLDNPDCLYLYAAIRGDAVYRISGRRGSANHIDLQVNFGHFSNGDVSTWGTISSCDGFELDTAPDGSFDLYLGGDERAGHWLPTREDAQFVLVRQYFADWESEQPADLLIERVGDASPIAPPTGEFVADRLEKLGRWIEKGGALWERMSRGFLSLEPNTLVVHRPEAAGERAGMRGQAYGMGHFACEPDEAVIVELAPPRCHHWGVALANHYWEAIEYASRQSSLNGAQARLDADGVFRGVIAHRDPGVPNWLDPAGRCEGTITARFLRADSAPRPRFTRIPLGDLRAVLPRDTPHVSPAERAEQLARRRRAVLHRFRT